MTETDRPRSHPPLLALGAAATVGSLLGDGIDTPSSLVLLTLAVLLVCRVAARPSGRLVPWALAAAALATGAVGMGAWNVRYDANPLRQATTRLEASGPVLLKGRAAADLVPGDARRRLLLDVTSLEAEGRSMACSGRATVRLGGDMPLPPVREDQSIAAWATLEDLRSASNRFVAGPPARARVRGVHAGAFVKSVSLFHRGPHPQSVRGWLSRIRFAARERLEHLMPDRSERGLVAALVFGDLSGVEPATIAAFRRSGLGHLLAVSGAQVALLAAIGAAILRRARAPRLIAAMLLACVACAFAALAGAEASVLRATLMSIAGAWAAALDLDRVLPNLLGLAALALVVFAPASASDPGFQLSFAATGGLIAFGPLAHAATSRWPRWLCSLPLASLCAMAAVFPVQLAIFSTASWAGLIANIVAVPLATAALVGGVALMTFGPALAVAAAPLATGLGFVARLLAWVATQAAAWPGATVLVPAPPLWALVAYCGGLAGVAVRYKPLRSLALVAVGFLGALLGGGPTADGRLHAHVLDVGQGDAIVLVSPRGRAMVIDAGPGDPQGWNAGEAIVLPFLSAHGIARVDRLVISHAHPDHVGGVASVLRGLRPSEVWEGPAPFADPSYRSLDEAVSAASVGRLSVRTGGRALWDGVDIRVLGPSRRSAPALARNDDSVVLLVRYAATTWLFPGDIEAAGEARIAWPRADFLKIAHHGSRTSSTPWLVDASRPSLAAVSVGRRNRYGHPSTLVLDRMRRVGALLLRTDEDGAVHVASDGTRLWADVDALPGATWCVPRAESSMLRSRPAAASLSATQ